MENNKETPSLTSETRTFWQQAQDAAKKVWVGFKSLPVKVQRTIGVAIGVLVIAVMIVGLYSSFSRTEVQPVSATTTDAIPYPDLVPAPLGLDRHKFTPEQLAWRESRIIETRRFWIMREGGAVKGAERVTQNDYQTYLNAAAELYGVNKADIEAIHYLESFGEEKAKSPTGPKGPGQFAAKTAANIGPVKDGKCLLLYKGQKCGDPKPSNSNVIAEDNRENIELSVYATAKLLKSELDFFGQPEFAIAAYHSGRGKIADWVKKYIEPKATTNGGKADIQANNLTYGKLYFGTTPYANPGTYKMYRNLMDVDWGPNYIWKVRSSQNDLNIFRKNKDEFEKIADQNKFRGKRAKYRMWTFYDEKLNGADELKTIDDLKARIKDGRLVTIPQNPEKFGFKLRLQGTGVIGELDLDNQKDYIASKQETAGALIWISQEVKKLREGRSKPFTLDVTSVSRTVEYQNKLTKRNSTATKELSFHVLGSAFDIAILQLSDDQIRDLRFILDELDSTGMISWVPENKAYHVVVAPDEKAIEFFRRVFRDNNDISQPSPLVTSTDWF